MAAVVITGTILVGVPLAVRGLAQSESSAAPPGASPSCAHTARIAAKDLAGAQAVSQTVAGNAASWDGDSRIGTYGPECKLTMLPSEVAANHSPALSLDGTQLAFVRIPNPNATDAYLKTQLVVADVATGVERVLVDGSETDYLNSPSWSPDGRSIAFGRDSQASGHSAIWTYDFATNKTQLVDQGETAQASPSWSPDGSKMLFLQSGDPSKLVLVDTKSGDRVGEVGFKDGYVADGSFSPDGSQIAVWFEAESPTPEAPYGAANSLLIVDATTQQVVERSDEIDGRYRDLRWDASGITLSVDESILLFDQGLDAIASMALGTATYFN